MKSRFCIIILLNTLPIISIAQKVDKKETNLLSMTISIAPASTFIQPNYDDNRIFSLTNFYYSIDYNFYRGLTFSTGLHWFHKGEVNHSEVIIPSGYSGPRTTTFKYNIVSIPTGLLFNVFNPNEKINIYLKTELLNSWIKYYTDEYPNNDGIFESYTDNDYGLSIGFGAGIDVRLKDRLSIIVEPVRSYSITGSLNTKGFMDCKVGLKYRLIAPSRLKNNSPNT